MILDTFADIDEVRGVETASRIGDDFPDQISPEKAMHQFERTHDGQTGQEIWETALRGQLLLGVPLLNKGTAFSEEERQELGLTGLLPPEVTTIEAQADNLYDVFSMYETDIEKHIFLRDLQDRNEVLFYRLLSEHVHEMMPLIYTPVVGEACQRFSHITHKMRGLFISYPHRNELEQVLENAPKLNPEIIVVTDGERILGLGDQGAGGMGIPIGKLSLYVLCGGVHPASTLPIFLDVGTNNQDRLNDPLYYGWRHERIAEAEYDDFIESFIQAIGKRFPNVLLQWEDFALNNAHRLLTRYRNRLCTFNDDIQGTAAVALATLLAALDVSGVGLKDQDIAIVGGGSAGTGIANEIVHAMMAEGLSEAEALTRFWVIDRNGLVHTRQTGLLDFQQRFAQPLERTEGWELKDRDCISLLEVVENVKPRILIGVCGQPNVFTEEIVRKMAGSVDRPIIFPLSNPTSRAEARPADLLAWTDGRALLATGSPFGDVAFGGKRYGIAQSNNAYVFPGVGLGVIASMSCRITDSMLFAAAKALSELSPARKDATAPLLPDLNDIRSVSRHIARAVGAQAQAENLAPATSSEELENRIAIKMWTPRYARVRHRRTA